MTALLTVWLVLALASHAAAHVALVLGLLARRLHVRAVVAFLVPPLAPYWGWDIGMRNRALAWIAALAAYAIGVGVASI